MSTLKILPELVTVIDPMGSLYVVAGRRPDERTVQVNAYIARDAFQATEAMTAELWSDLEEAMRCKALHGVFMHHETQCLAIAAGDTPHSMPAGLRPETGSLFVNLNDEYDCDHNDCERVTPAGSIWRLEMESDRQLYHLICLKTGAWVIPDVNNDKAFVQIS